MNGAFYIGAAPVAGRINGETLLGLGDIVERYGLAGARLNANRR